MQNDLAHFEYFDYTHIWAEHTVEFELEIFQFRIKGHPLCHSLLRTPHIKNKHFHREIQTFGTWHSKCLHSNVIRFSCNSHLLKAKIYFLLALKNVWESDKSYQIVRESQLWLGIQCSTGGQVKKSLKTLSLQIRHLSNVVTSYLIHFG